MEYATYLLFTLGCLGGLDILLFHSVAHGIRSHPDSVKELITHSLRGPTYAALFVLIPNFALHGLFAWLMAALLLFDVAISIWDFSLEQGSRRFLGGLPAGEYVLHMVMAMIFGTMVAGFLYGAAPWFSAPSRLIYAPAAVPAVLRIAMMIFAILVLVSGVQDAVAAFRMSNHRRESNKPALSSPLVGRTSPCAASHVLSNPRSGLHRKLAMILPLPFGGGEGRGEGNWMRFALVTAGFYNLVWGAWVVLFPAALFRIAGLAAINYPPIWQCVGMIVGVYGIGYLIAARQPLRHWPIVLVGLLGKVLGPIGMCWSVANGALPASLAWTCLANDLLWWVPFSAILWRACKLHRHDHLA